MDSINAVAFNSLRFVLATGVLFLVLIVKYFIEKKFGKNSHGFNMSTILGGALCGLSLFLASNVQQYAIAYTTVGKASFITAMYIVIVPVLGLLMRRRASVLCSFAIAIAAIGFYFMCIGDELKLSYGDGLMLLCAVLFSIQILFIDFFGRDSDPIKITFVQFFTASVLNIPSMAVFGFPMSAQIGSCILPILYVGLCSTGLGYTLQSIGQKYTEPAVATLIMSLESVIGMIGGIIFLHETQTVRELAGCLLVLIGVFLAQFEIPRRFLVFDRRTFALTQRSAR